MLSKRTFPTRRIDADEGAFELFLDAMHSLDTMRARPVSCGIDIHDNSLAPQMNKMDKPAAHDGQTFAPSQLGVRLRLARQTLGMTLKALATAADCSESLLSKIENGKASPSLPMLHRLVGVLGTNIGWMFEEADGDEGIIFRAGDRPLIALDPLRRGEGISLERVIPYSAGHLLQCNIHHIEAGGESAGPIQHAGEEVGYLLAGEIELMVGERTFRLAQGDSFVFKSEMPHWYRNVGSERASIFWVNTPATF